MDVRIHRCLILSIMKKGRMNVKGIIQKCKHVVMPPPWVPEETGLCGIEGAMREGAFFGPGSQKKVRGWRNGKDAFRKEAEE
jgi:hypothetical protein